MITRRMLLSCLTIVALSAFVLGNIAFLSQPAEAAPSQEDGNATRTITVTGYGTASGSPDMAFMSVGVEISNRDIAIAVSESNERVDAVIEALQDVGIAADDIRTEYFNIYQERFGSSMPSESGMAEEENNGTFRVTNMLRVIVRDVDTVGDVLSTAIEAGANTVNGVIFEISNRAELQSEARNAAYDNGVARAEELAALMGAELGEVLSIQENVEGGYGMFESAGVGMGGGGGASISPGALQVSISVTITFAVN